MLNLFSAAHFEEGHGRSQDDSADDDASPILQNRKNTKPRKASKAMKKT
jgi:hypothetical protein